MSRIAILKVGVVLDPVPGAFHEARDATQRIQNILDQAIGHYNPVVTLDEEF